MYFCICFLFRKVTLGGVELKPVQNNSDISFLEIGPTLQIEEKVVQKFGPNEFWNSLPIMELEHVVTSAT